MLYFNFNTTKTISHFSVNKLTNFNYSDYFKEQNKQKLEEKPLRVYLKKNIRR